MTYTKLMKQQVKSRHYRNAWDIAYMYGLTNKIVSILPVSNYIRNKLK